MPGSEVHSGGVLPPYDLTKEASIGQRQFTLIELLVVIGVIAILAALLLPALNSARERSKAIKCVGNLKQLGVATFEYCDDYQQWLPFSYVPGNDYGYWNFNPNTGAHFVLLAPYLNVPVYDCWRLGPTSAGVTCENVLMCPSVRINKYPSPYVYGHYLMPHVLGSGGILQPDGKTYMGKMTMVKEPSQRLWLADGFASSTKEAPCFFNSACILTDPNPGFSRHRGGANCLFFDGHVDWLGLGVTSTPACGDLFKPYK